MYSVAPYLQSIKKNILIFIFGFLHSRTGVLFILDRQNVYENQGSKFEFQYLKFEIRDSIS